MLNGIDLFTGYAGITLALRDYVRPLLYCEIERYAQGIILSRMDEKRIPFAPIWNDVTSLDGTKFRGLVDIIYGGFPCQDISTAGNGSGLDGERSGLFREVIRLAKEAEAPFVFLENVPAIRTRGLNEVISAFTEIGYDCRWTCNTAGGVGAPHIRKRWFLLAHSRCEGRQQIPRGSHGHEGENEWRSTKKDHKPECMAQENLWSRGHDSLHGVDARAPFRMDRIKALGNGVVPLQVKAAFEKLMGMHDN